MLPNKSAKPIEIPELLSEQKRSNLGGELAKLQRRLQDSKKSMLVIIDGWESSGKGYLLKDLTRELDPRYYEVSVFEDPSLEESRHPYLYRYFMKAPHAGNISFFDRSFYFELFNRVDLDEAKLAHYIDDIEFVEEALVNNDTLVVKLFLHQTEDVMRKNIEKLENDDYRHVRLDAKDYTQLERYAEYYKHFESVLEQTNHARSPWDVLFVDGKKDRSRQALAICIDRLEKFLDSDTKRAAPELAELPDAEDMPLAKVDLSLSISDEEYDERLKALQAEAGDLLYQVYLEGKGVIVAYEGTDAAGKGGNIRRLTRQMDPRGYDVATTASPSEKELAHHYLWRFYRDFPTRGRMTIYDRTWYGRVLVERIEKITPEYRWKEAYKEINQMEHNLVHDGYLVLKYLIVIDKDEQLERFEARAEDPDKQHKLTDEDWRNREKFDVYKQAMNEMVVYTSTEDAPWKVVSGTSKKHARIAVLEDFIQRVSAYLRQ